MKQSSTLDEINQPQYVKSLQEWAIGYRSLDWERLRPHLYPNAAAWLEPLGLRDTNGNAVGRLYVTD